MPIDHFIASHALRIKYPHSHPPQLLRRTHDYPPPSCIYSRRKRHSSLRPRSDNELCQHRPDKHLASHKITSSSAASRPRTHISTLSALRSHPPLLTTHPRRPLRAIRTSASQRTRATSAPSGAIPRSGRRKAWRGGHLFHFACWRPQILGQHDGVSKT